MSAGVPADAAWARELARWPRAVLEELAGRRVGLAGFGRSESERLAAILHGLGAQPRETGAREPLAISAGDLELLVVRAGSDAERALRDDVEGPAILVVGPAAELLPLGGRLSRWQILLEPWDDRSLVLRSYIALRGTPRQGAASGGPRPVVLVVDDDETITALVARLLEDAGCRCHTARDGVEALTLAARMRLDALVLDLNMPGRDGYQVLTALRSDGGIRPAVVLLTARRREADVLRGFELGADDYVVKPFSPPELVARVGRLIGVR